MRYQPHVVMVPIAGRFMMHPDDAAFATKLLMTDNPNLKTAIPQHHRFKGRPGWMGTPEEYEAEIRKLGLKVEVLSPEIGKVYTLKKRRRGAARSREIDLEGVPSATLRCVRAAGRMARSTVAWPPVAPGVLIGSACDARRASRSGSTRARSACR